MASLTYVDNPNANLVCCICRSPFVEPCTTRTCCHTFCYECISQAIAINRQCPIDRTPLSVHDLTPADPVIRNLVDELIVRCPQEPLGCPYTCQRLLLPIHVKDVCQFIEVPCPEARCSSRILRRDVKEHQCSESGVVKLASSQEYPETDSRDHPEEKSTTSASASASPTTSTGQPPSDLAAENAMLRLRLSALESVVHTLRSEMFAVKHALGPWYRPDVHPEVPQEEQPEDFEASIAFERQLAEELAPATAVARSDNPPSSAPRDSIDIASYFPPPETVSTHTGHGSTSSVAQPYLSSSVGQSHVPLSPPSSTYPSMYASTSPTSIYAASSFPTPGHGQTPGMPYAQGSSFTPNAPASISIPPLDPSTPLPDTLATLHSSLVTLAGALGALAASRGAESLRTTEELRGLRAATHGLRMQVHDILTSRSHLAGGGAPGSSGDGDGGEQPSFNLGMSGWLGFGGPRPYGIPPPVLHPHHPASFGGSVIPPTNITKL
ncbi:hypothetical protein BD311DRAFT_263620 [Dichomitus squalens]|uniref:RING-type domain-containing protein n=1 Tax=Dichomitus squalens TaxID=114155 RepID=A0A4Q9MP54_9APHY|nr:hypothetical protein BD311DRAFT_263620 [Dichomitus squalens]